MMLLTNIDNNIFNIHKNVRKFCALIPIVCYYISFNINHYVANDIDPNVVSDVEINIASDIDPNHIKFLNIV